MKNTESQKSQKLNPIIKLYLIIYNLLSALGWMYLLYETAVAITSSWTKTSDFFESKNIYINTKQLLKILIATPFLEILHAITRIVPSNPMVVITQVVIRCLVVWGIVDNFEASNKSFGLVLLILAWSISEIIRYFYYMFNLLDKEPYFLKWCRYNFFIVLYPIGALAEIICIVYAAQYIQPTSIRKQYSLTLPNKYNFSFDLFNLLLIWIAIYFPGFPFMYKHMLVQRKKYLYGSKTSTTKATKVN